jgi:hypothetical protein
MSSVARMGKGRIAALLGGAIAATFLTFSPLAAQSVSHKSFAWRLLATHNAERDRLGIPRLKWSSKLAGEAQTWAENLAARNTMQHSTSAQRRGAGENLWMGSVGAYDAEVMVGAFVDEKRDFHPGVFPQNSSTGRWEDVGHYTQLIWAGTQEVGCAVAHNAQNDFLVCRYWPAGNTVGVQVP